MTFQSRITSAVATGALLLSMTSPAFAETIEISGNGAGSFNNATVDTTNTQVVSQNNSAAVTNNVSSNASSGGNSANFNTGGNTSVSSGNANSTTAVSTAVNANHADLDCCLVNGAGNTTISGNGANSVNNATVNSNNTLTLGQNNSAAVTNNVYGNAKSGHNSAAFNTGGDVTVHAGSATSVVGVATLANANLASVGGGLPGNTTGNTSATIVGNGAGSFNTIGLDLNRALVVGQNNSAAITNNVSSDAKSGGNSADFNTGGDVIVTSGPASAKAFVDTLANFNSADIDCGCLLGGLNAKISGNGAGAGHASDYLWLLGSGSNNIWASLNNTSVLGQNNSAALTNNVDAEGKSGYNSSDFNTGDVSGISDPAVVSGAANSETHVTTKANLNNSGDGLNVTLPGGSQVSLQFNIAALLSWLHWI